MYFVIGITRTPAANILYVTANIHSRSRSFDQKTDHNSNTSQQNNMDDDFFLLLYNEEMQQAVTTTTSYRDCLSVAERRNRSGVIRRGSLRLPHQSPFRFLFDSGQDDGLITLCGFDHASFNSLLQIFAPVYDAYTPYAEDGSFEIRVKETTRNHHMKGRPRLTNATDALLVALGAEWRDHRLVFFPLPFY
jgi:hypothetical protein